MPEFPKRWYVRIKTGDGELHTVHALGRTAGEAEINGRRIAERLLKTHDLEVRWVKEYN